MITRFKKSPLFTFMVKMMITVFVDQFNFYTIVQGNAYIIKRRHLY